MPRLNKEENRKYSAEYYKKNKEKRADYNKKYYSLHRDEFREYDKIRNQTPSRKGYLRDYLRKNKVKYNLIERKRHPDKHKARRWSYKNRDKKCEICGSKEKLEFHHTDYKNNIGITLCFKCHRDLHKN